MRYTGAANGRCSASAWATVPRECAGVVIMRDLDLAMKWFRENPADERNAAARLEKMAVIQAAADALESQAYEQYVKAWSADPAAADRMEREPALHYLSRSIGQAIEDIRGARVRKGMALWHLYNMGYVFKTSRTCWGVDLAFRDARRLAKDLDFLLVSHQHADHRSDELIAEMIHAGKPVVTSFAKGGLIVPCSSGEQITSGPASQSDSRPAPREFSFPGARVKVDLGDHHHPKSVDDMLMFQIDCEDDAGGCTVYHVGDASNLAKLRPDRPVDVFIPHVSVGLPIESAIKQINPRMTLVSHVLELGHSPKPPQPWRWSFRYAYNTIRNIPPRQAAVLTWGERWLLPGTVLE